MLKIKNNCFIKARLDLFGLFYILAQTVFKFILKWFFIHFQSKTSMKKQTSPSKNSRNSKLNIFIEKYHTNMKK